VASASQRVTQLFYDWRDRLVASKGELVTPALAGLPAGNLNLTAGNPNAPTAPGFYYLAISSFNNDPLAPGALRIFPDPEGVGVTVGPTGPGGAQAVAAWNNGGNSAGTYQIALTGALFAEVPEPSSYVLFGVGVLGVFALGCRRRLALNRNVT
jgi:hypothetical protein